MTVSSTVASQTFACNGGTVVFTCPFRVLATTELDAYLVTISTGAQTQLVNGVDFVVTNAGTAANAVVTTVATYSTLYRLKCKRSTARLQETDYRDNDPFPAETHEKALDRLTMLAQEDDEAIGRTIRAPDGETLSELPVASSRASTAPAFDSSGNLTVMVPVSGSAADVLIQLADTSDVAKGDAKIGVKRTATGAVVMTGHSWLEAQRFNVKEFGAVGDGVANDTAAIAACLLAAEGSDVYIPEGSYVTSASLTLGNQRIVGANKETTFIKPNGNFAAFINDTSQFISGSLQRLTIYYGAVAPTVSGTDGNKKAIFFSGAKWPTFYNIEDIEVRGAWAAYSDAIGTYATTLRRVFVRDSFSGFVKSNGTTMHFDQCITLTVNNPFTITDVIAAKFTACACDAATVTAGNAAATFSGCTGLVIDGWDAESNSVTGEAASLMNFLNCTGELNGFVGYLNTLATSAGGDTVALLRFSGSQMKVGGCRTSFDSGSLVFSGTGTVYTLLAVSTSAVNIAGSRIETSTGGSPAARHALGSVSSTVNYVSTLLSGTVLASYELADTEVGTWTPVPASLTVTGTPTYAGKYVRHGKTYFCTLTITAAGGTTESTAGTTVFTGLPANPSVNGVCNAVNSLAVSRGCGLVRTDGNIYPPTWAADGNNVSISFTIQIA